MITVLFPAIVSAQRSDTIFIQKREGAAYRTDTVFFDSPMKRHILIGTTILPSTQNQMQARNYGLYLNKITESSCQKVVEHIEEGKINSIIETDSTLTIDINIADNCCYAFLCDVSVDSTATIKLIYHSYGTYCACNCCFGLTYHFSKATHETSPKIKAVMINDERKTLKRIKK